jgi:hypothetical protein
MTHAKKQDRIKPWQDADYHRFCELCCDGYGRPDGELLRNNVYQWLKKNVPRAVTMTDGESQELPHKRMLIVAEYVLIMTMMRPAAGAAEVARARKWHKKVQVQIERLQKTLGEGRWMPLPRLDETLAWALPILDTRTTKAEQPWLKQLARELHQQTGRVDAELLLEMAVALTPTPSIDARTAQRYAKEARKAVNDR